MQILLKDFVGITLSAGGEMINFSSNSHIFLLPGATDMRKAINGLVQMVADHTIHDVLSGAFFIFCNKSSTIIKILYWDNNGFCLWQKRLEKDRFSWPQTVHEVMELGPQELRWLLDGLDPFSIKGHQKLAYKIVK